MSAALDNDEYLLLEVDRVFVFRVPPRPSAGGYKAAEWNKSEHQWAGQLRVVSKGQQAAVKLVHQDTGKLFAVCVVRAEGKPTIEKVTDSSRYFVLRIEDGKGHHAFIGLGFPERSEAFDFNAALKEFKEDVEREKAPALDYGPSTDMSLKAGETIRISVPTKKKSGGGTSGGGGGLGLAPPTASGRSKYRSGTRATAPLGSLSVAAAAAAPAPSPAPVFAPVSAPAPAPAAVATADDGFAGDPFADPFGADPFADPTATTAAPAPASDPFGF